MSNYIITIARGLGSGGSHIGKALSKELGIPYYDDEILEMASELSGINEAYFYEANEKIRKGQLAVNNSKGVYNSTVYKIGDKQYLSNENLFNFQALIMKNLALGNDKSCIIIGKAANHIIGSLNNVVSVNIQAPLNYCVKNIQRRMLKSEDEARELILKTDKYRSNYYKYYTGGSWMDCREYDLTINTEATGEELAVEFIKSMLKKKKLID